MDLPRHPRVAHPQLKDLLAREPGPVPTIAADAPVSEVLGLMAERDIDAVAVVEGDRVVGIFSDRAYLRRMAAGTALAALTPVREVMDDRLVFATPQDTVSESVALLSGRRIRSLAVFEAGHLVGMLSIDALLKELLAHYERVFKAIELDQLVLFARGTYSC